MFVAYRLNGPLSLAAGLPASSCRRTDSSRSSGCTACADQRFKANDTYADANNDPESYLKTMARIDDGPEVFPAGKLLLLSGMALSGLPGLERVEYWLRPDAGTHGRLDEGDPAWNQATWKPCKLDAPPQDWSSHLPNGVRPHDLWGFDRQTGQPKEWPLHYSVVRWAVQLENLAAGAYEFRVRTVDRNGFAQPEPRTYPKSGRNEVQCRTFMVQGMSGTSARRHCLNRFCVLFSRGVCMRCSRVRIRLLYTTTSLSTGKNTMPPSFRFLRKKSGRRERLKYRPRLESLESRLTPSGAPFAEPPVIQSDPVTHILTATLTEEIGPAQVGDVSVVDAWTYNGIYAGPTLKAQPGDLLDITIVNHLPESTNLHTHGLRVSPLGNSDDVLLEIEPNESNHFQIQIPADHPEGLYWYHPHMHGDVNNQITRGLSGMIIIGNANGGAPELAQFPSYVLGLKNAQLQGNHIVNPQEISNLISIPRPRPIPSTASFNRSYGYGGPDADLQRRQHRQQWVLCAVTRRQQWRRTAGPAHGRTAIRSPRLPMPGAPTMPPGRRGTSRSHADQRRERLATPARPRQRRHSYLARSECRHAFDDQFPGFAAAQSPHHEVVAAQ